MRSSGVGAINEQASEALCCLYVLLLVDIVICSTILTY